MTDKFALLNEPRRPWLEADWLKQKFLALAADLHPDRVHNAGDAEKSTATKRYAELNAAYHCLLEPKSRLLHLLELERGAKPPDIQQIPNALADLFATVATACRGADAFLLEKGRATSPLVRVQFFEQEHDWVRRLNELKGILAGLRENLTNELKSLDSEWLAKDPIARQGLLPKLEQLYRLFGYLNRWSSQLQERIVQLAF